MINKTFAKERKTSGSAIKSTLRMLAVGGLFLGAGLLQSCDKDILTGQPEWLGNSIYERLQEGIDGKKFSTTLRLIDDLGQKEVLSHTGSKTLFVTSDEDYAKWFANNAWGVTKYEDLTLAQKKLLLNNSMINNAYLIELMSNVSGNPPKEGLCMRRPTALSVQDSIGTIAIKDMPVDPMLDPKRDSWKKIIDKKQPLTILRDATPAPMIHFLPAFMERNEITGEDLKVLTNGVSTSTDDAWINGRKVISREQTCKNGYVYVVDGVIEANRNMAQIISDEPEMSEWAKILNRFSYPDFDPAANDEYQRLHNLPVDRKDTCVMVLRYFADTGYRTSGNRAVANSSAAASDNYPIASRLPFDPGWNNYMYANPLGYDMHYDAGAMIVPTNEAIEEWKKTDGSGLIEAYQSLDKIPALTISKLVRVNMLPNFVDAVPSKFHTIVDDAKVDLKLRPENVVKTYMGCNGVVYLVNKVFAPSEYRSVSYPALANRDRFGVIYWAIDNLDYGAYLNSMEATYGLLLPNNNAMLYYVDPCFYGLGAGKQQLYEFYYDDENEGVAAIRTKGTFEADGSFTATGTPTKLLPGNAEISNRLKDLVDNLIIVLDHKSNETLEQGEQSKKTYYKTKAGSVIGVDNAGGIVNGLAGGMQMNNGYTIPIVGNPYDMTKGGNGKSYEVSEIPMTSMQTVYSILKKHSEEAGGQKLFFEMLGNDVSEKSLVASSVKVNSSTSRYCIDEENDKNITLLDNYNYTIFVPNDAEVQKLIDDGYLPTWEDYLEYCDEQGMPKTDKESKIATEVIAKRIQDFVKYHVMDNAIYIGGNTANDRYETSALNEKTRKFYTLQIFANPDGLTVTDSEGTKSVINSGNALKNVTAREYWIEGKATDAVRNIYSSSNAVVHSINGVLIFDASIQKTPWKKEIEDKIAAAN